PDEVHRMGLDQVQELHGRMEPILRSIGYTQGSVGERMQQLAKDPRYKFSEGDKGRAEIMAFIQERLKLIRAQLPRAFHTMVRGNLKCLNRRRRKGPRHRGPTARAARATARPRGTHRTPRMPRT